MIDPVRRVHFFYGQLLTPEDFQAEQDYHREMRYLHNRLLGHGVVHGLEVTGGDGTTVIVSPGLAIDRGGRELVLTDEVAVVVDGTADPDCSREVVAIWAQEPDGFVVSALPTADGDDGSAYSRWLERPRVELWPPGEAPESGVVLGQVRLSAGGVTAVDDCGRISWRRA